MTQFSDISVVIHGPVSSLPDRGMDEGITQKSVQSVREHLPGARIILSTWEDQDVSGLDYDVLKLNQDPGCNIVGYNKAHEPRKENNNRQIVAVREGLKLVETPYAVKLRSDNYLCHSGFVGLQQAFPYRAENYRIFDERVVVPHKYTKMVTDGRQIARHLCDFFAYGRTTDLLRMWDIPLLEDYPLDTNIHNRPQYHGCPERIISAEQHFTCRWLAKLTGDQAYLQHHFDASPALLTQWQQILANNFVISEAHNMGLKTVARLSSHKVRANEMSHAEWQMLYRQYCYPEYLPPVYQYYFGGMLYRKLKSPWEKIKRRIKAKTEFGL
ncbi:WavE lipopolysaccharide synthesis family protein [Shewanella sp. GXUN23E]|uniref:WavE lipopolysaccharide synthesis family protein n=1 Tax=Shewanella sp. GXUN23E TaxID=3422498 RepID=UPI003D7EBBC5